MGAAIEFYSGIAVLATLGGLNSNLEIAVSTAVLVSGLTIARSFLYQNRDRSTFRNSDKSFVKTESGLMGE